MEYNKTGRFKKKISKIGFGAWQLGNSTDFSTMSYDKGLALVERALEMGITFFDTAPNYAQGKSEEILGEALEGMEDEIFINTKAGHTKQGELDFSIDGIKASVEHSLKALRRNTLDSVILHNPEMRILQGKEGHYKFLGNLKEEGVIDGYGVSVDTPEELEAVLTSSDVDVIELLFNIIHQSPKIWFDEIRKRDILLTIKVPLDSGWLTGRFNENTSFEGIRSRWTQDNIRVRSSIVEEIKDIVQKEDLVPVALSFILSFDAITNVIPGIRTEQQLISNIEALNYEMTPQIKNALEQLYEKRIRSLETPW